MRFTKMHGIGNDYVYVNGFEEKVDNKSQLAITLSDRHFGIGSDGLIFVNPSDVADLEMEMYNADGSRAEMCGNGIRCVAKFAYDNGIVDKTEFTINTLAGVKTIMLHVDEKTGKAASAVVDMGAPILKPELIPVNVDEMDFAEECDMILDRPLIINDDAYKITAVSMGNPHAIVFIDENVRECPIDKIGPVFECHPAFPRRTNTEFVRIIDRNTVEMRVWERGSGETLACGTGACATVVACILNGLTDNTVTVKLLGGDLTISWDGTPDGHVFMEGSATTVFTGEI